jgi:hypothetical protein
MLVDNQTNVLYNKLNEHTFAKERFNMKEIGNFYVKLNCKNVDNIRSLIIDRQEKYIKQQEKYIMCAGKYDKNGWTLVFRARSFEEAEELANMNPFMHKKEIIN